MDCPVEVEVPETIGFHKVLGHGCDADAVFVY